MPNERVKNCVRTVPAFLGLNRSTAGVLVMVVLVGLGEKMAERFLPIYLIALGGGALSIGLLNGLDNLLSALYSYPGGYLADRLGTKRALLLFNLVAMVGFLVVVLVPTWQAVLVGAVFFLSWSAVSLPATMGLVARVLPPTKRTMGVTMHSLVKRLPMALGPILGGLCIAAFGEESGVRAAFALAFALSGVAAVIQQRLIEEDPARVCLPGAPQRPKNPLRRMGDLRGPLKGLLFSDVLIRFCEQIPYAFVVVWCMKTIEEPVTAVQFGILTGIEMTVAVLVYIPVAYLADRGAKKPFVLATFAFFTLFPLALYYSRSFVPLVFAFALRGLKEFGEPTRKTMIMELAPEGRKAEVFGLYYLVRDLFVSAAALGGAFLWMLGPAVNFLAAFAFGLAGTIGFALWGPEVGREKGSRGAR
jgi:MFS family permease